MAITAVASLRAFRKMADHSPLVTSADSVINEDTTIVRYGSNRCKNVLNVVLILGFIVVGSVVIIVLLLVRPNVRNNPEYGVVFDAGSRHTSAYVYKWPGNIRLRGTAVPVDEICHVSNSTGISSFVNNPKGAGSLVGNLLKNVIGEVPHDKRSSTPVYLGATAGMRLEREVNKTISDNIMSSIRDVFLASSLQFSAKNAKIITGKDEGSFGWITVNYLKKVLQEKNEEDIKETSGALDLGGASTQITFVPQNTSQANQHFRLYGKDYPVYTKTYLCYGLSEIYRRFLAQLAKNANYSATISNPCARKGSITNQSASNIFREPCSCEPSPKPRTAQFTFNGSNNESECNENIRSLFDYSSTCPNAVPFFNASHKQPPVTGNFLAFSAYYIIKKNLNLPTSPTMDEYRSAYLAYCNRNVVERKTLDAFVTVVPTCFSGHYIYTLLTYGFQFKNDTWKISFGKTKLCF
ncbi:ectonucleoside triphosphate diphosphohydrolase 1-like isoform X2 [Dendronephthya gigantea]|uniref:ectonucleoside triphosphate diphosphohydrolase 1-like isoform X2 n=1 Tax=Dendronephthya gigantea TaxID=151771 RepID=UPI00106C9927|nr:ectonucleoside triphosphate diphosphohydrolase 1-like isoform X2 [Dendronephthya gigantea]